MKSGTLHWVLQKVFPKNIYIFFLHSHGVKNSQITQLYFNALYTINGNFKTFYWLYVYVCMYKGRSGDNLQELALPFTMWTTGIELKLSDFAINSTIPQLQW